MPGCSKLITGKFLHYQVVLLSARNVRIQRAYHVVGPPTTRLLWTLQIPRTQYFGGGAGASIVSKPNGRLCGERDGYNNISIRGPERTFSSWMRTPFVFVESVRGGRYKSRSNNNGENELGETTIMHQDGHEIQEVPMAVLKNRSNNSRPTEGKGKGEIE